MTTNIVTIIASFTAGILFLLNIWLWWKKLIPAYKELIQRKHYQQSLQILMLPRGDIREPDKIEQGKRIWFLYQSGDTIALCIYYQGGWYQCLACQSRIIQTTRIQKNSAEEYIQKRGCVVVKVPSGNIFFK